ncbi:sugar O-acetyltransferase [Clostridium tagluense]|uniref:sugar O-acetyltransferase n=1 Tax=Clostridium tagluense TaxID=360422 RepID=UPI001C0B4732|nr:sugar O-acetyltransferase [Clostridium tagluense]MBU3129320.1 sugar O-acetyltransferase [Clostridium tagluense]MCB2312369.1 sugar O-acetyltransferase [Clostridium tagluense]MCB2317044.1 sugar O-acetyltransferase [Clostridium tagluense]MCB2321929.1 sugar O-acetyltransferase [Clostridium tagluense]MCB2326844.1 sugar O-acetyltransferase [Clostridium tagluense]
MTEKEKMIGGKAYKAFGEELSSERQAAKEMIFDYNSLRPSEGNKQKEILKKLLGVVRNDFYIEPPFRCDYGYNISIGENFYSNYNCTILDCAKVTIGDNVMFAPNVSLFTAGHPIHFEPRNAGLEYAFPINIGNNVWLGGGVIVNPGITIGDNVVIGSGSVVTKDIPPNSIAVGNPCKVIRQISEEDKKYYFKKLKFND